MIVTTLVMLALLTVALAVFARSCWVKYELMRSAARPENRFDRIWDRVDAALVFAFGQRRMFKDPVPGLMHALIFWGFLILLVRSISLVGSAFTHDMNWSLFFFSEPLHLGYTLLKDLTELWVLAMVLFAFYRRLVIKPERLKKSSEAESILTMIGLLMVTDFLLDGAKFLQTSNPEVAAERTFAPVGSLVANLYEALGVTWAGLGDVLFHVPYWAHIVVLLYFLNYLPRSKHMHVITAIPNVFLRNLRKGYPLQPIEDIEGEFEKEDPRIGVGRIEDLTWKQVLDLYTCTECGRCTVNCPADLTGKPLKPRQFTEDLRDYVVAEKERLIANRATQRRHDTALQAWRANGDGEEPVAPELAASDKDIVDQAGYDVIWSCTTCRSCEENCPVLIEYVDKMVDLRRNMVMMQSRMPTELNNVMRNLENKSNPWGLPIGDRADWCKDLDVPILGELDEAARAEIEYLFFVGCAGAYDARAQKVARAIVALLRAADVKFAILGTEEGCTGDTARRLGNEYLFQLQAAQNIEVFDGYGVRKILTMCPHCLQTIGNEYPALGGTYEVVHHSQLIAQLIAEGRLVPRGELRERWVFHDSCYLGRYNDIYDAPREALRAVHGLTLEETERARENGMCCGAGGGWMWMEESKGTRMNQLRVDQLLETKADHIATACPFCQTMMIDALGAKNLDETVGTKDIAEVVAESLERRLPSL